MFVEQALRDQGYKEFWNHKLHAFENRGVIGGKQFLKQLPIGSTIYGKKRVCDFLVINRNMYSFTSSIASSALSIDRLTRT
jgi:hypothetical protein